MVPLHSLNQERDRLNREELRQRIAAALTQDGTVEPLPNLHLYRNSRPSERIYGVATLSFCVIAQGAKTVLLGDREYRYDPHRYLLTTAELPITGCVVEATPEEPYLSIRIDLDPAMVASVMAEAGVPPPPATDQSKALVVSTLDPGLLDAVVRLLRLIDGKSSEPPLSSGGEGAGGEGKSLPTKPPHSNREDPLLATLIKRELILRLLMTDQAPRLRRLPQTGDHADRIARAIHRLQSDLQQPLRIESLARDLGMSPSGLHHHFKAVTDMSPLQFQKGLRLHEARRLMLSQRLDATSAGLRVGYEDASHFSRDYKRLFGESPMRDVERLRTAAVAD